MDNRCLRRLSTGVRNRRFNRAGLHGAIAVAIASKESEPEPEGPHLNQNHKETKRKLHHERRSIATDTQSFRQSRNKGNDMKLKILAVRDRAADVFNTPFFTATIGQAARSFADEINNPREGNTLNKHPEDFDLYHLGEYDDQNATFTTQEPRMVAIGKDLIQRMRNEPQLPLQLNGDALGNYGGTQ